MSSFYKRIRAYFNRNHHLIKLNYDLNKKIIGQNNELLWAHVYHDSIRGKKPLESLSLHIGRWAGNYSFFYILHRILSECKPKKILELGLGESTKFVSTYIENYLPETKHLIVEHDTDWKDNFNSGFKLSKNSRIKILEIHEKEFEGFSTTSYKGFDNLDDNLFQFYLIDGPFGSKRYSRNDILACIKEFPEDHQFVLLFDDYQRQGEKDTVSEVLKELDNLNISYFTQIYSGEKSQILIGSKEFKWVQSL